MHSQQSPNSLSALIHDLIVCIPEDIASGTQLSPALVFVIYELSTQIRKLRTSATADQWQQACLDELKKYHFTSQQMCNLTYCVMYSQDAKEFEPLMRSANSTFLNILFRISISSSTFYDSKILLELLYKNFIAHRIPNPEAAMTTVINFTTSTKRETIEIQYLNLAMSYDHIDKEVTFPSLEASLVCRRVFQNELEKHKELLLSQASTALKNSNLVTSSSNANSLFSKEKKQMLPLIISCLTYLKSNQPEDKEDFLNIYAVAVTMSQEYKKLMDVFFILENFQEKSKAKMLSVGSSF